MASPKPVLDLSFLNQTVTHTASSVPYEFEPKIGKEVMEFWPGASHPGHDIHVLHDVVGKSSTDIHDLLGTMDKRVIQGMPAEVSSAIDSGDISHIFRTNPGKSEAFTSLPQSVQDSLGGPQNTGSIYFRRKTGETARWKLPEIGTNDKGWNANKGNEIFSAATAYPDDTYRVSSLNAASKYVGKPNAAHALDQSLEAELQPHGYNVSEANIQRIRSRNPNLLGSEALSRVLPTPGTAAVKSPTGSAVDLSPEKMSFIETLKAEKAATEKSAREALPATKKSIEESGYLYHYAPREARDSIVSGGFDVSKARTAVGDIVGEASEFATHVPENSMYFYTRPEDAPSSGTIFGTGETGQRPDLYRTKIEPGMLDDMVVDPRLPVRDGVGSAVIVPSKTGKFEAELIGENAKFGIRGDNISPATYDPIHAASSVATDNATKVTPLAGEYDTGAKSAEVIKPKAPTKPKPGTIIINADGTQTLVKAEPLNPIIKLDDLASKATATATAPSVSSTSTVASTVSSGGAARVPAAVASTSPPVATAAARTAAAVTAPTAARSTRSLMSNALEVGQKVTRGHLGATALGVAAAGLLFGYANRDDD